MNGFLYGILLQWKLDIRSKSLLITCYLVPLLFFIIMGNIFTSINSEAKTTLIQSMTIMGISMGAFIGLPPSLIDTYKSDTKKLYKANGIPLYFGLVSIFISTFIHLFIMSLIIFIIAPIAFDASIPNNLPLYFISLFIFIITSQIVGSVLGLIIKNQAKLTMISQIIFLPSIMLSGIMFPINLLPKAFEILGNIFPASWGYKLMIDNQLEFNNLYPLLIILLISLFFCIFFLRRHKSQ